MRLPLTLSFPWPRSPLWLGPSIINPSYCSTNVLSACRLWAVAVVPGVVVLVGVVRRLAVTVRFLSTLAASVLMILVVRCLLVACVRMPR